MEVYVDDMLIKFIKHIDHIDSLQEISDVNKNYKKKVNPQKCVFGVTAGKFLEFMINHRGIESNLDKIQAIINMKSPTTLHKIQKLNGCLAALSCFQAKGAERSLPFMKIFRNASLEKEKPKKYVIE